jgi:hypothetical protein
MVEEQQQQQQQRKGPLQKGRSRFIRGGEGHRSSVISARVTRQSVASRLQHGKQFSPERATRHSGETFAANLYDTRSSPLHWAYAGAH